MNKMGSAAKVKLNSFDDLFRTEQPQAGTEQVQEIALSELHEFKGHQANVGGTGDSQFSGKGIHGASNTPCSGSTGKKHHATSTDNGGFFN